MTTRLHARAACGALLLVATVALPACAASRALPHAAPDSATCSAIAAAADSLVIGHEAVRLGLVEVTRPFREQGTVPAMWRQLRDMPWLDSSTLHDFERRNATPTPSCATLPLVGGVTTIAQADIDALPTGDAEAYWRAFHAKFPGVAGVTSTSGVGIGMGGRQALLTIDHGCGSLCGTGHIVLLERDDAGKWKVKRAVMTWIS